MQSGLVTIPQERLHQCPVGLVAATFGLPAATHRRDEVSDQDNRAFRLGAGEGRRTWAFGDLMILKLTAAQTSGRVFVMEQHVPRHRRAPGRHVHEVDDQSWFVIAGRGRWFIGDETIDAGPGDFVHGPHGVAHAFSADTDDLHVLVITAPAASKGSSRRWASLPPSRPTRPPTCPNPPRTRISPAGMGRRRGPKPRWTPQKTLGQ